MKNTRKSYFDLENDKLSKGDISRNGFQLSMHENKMFKFTKTFSHIE